jgi:diguanylate cyclase (GGDEF)-like protein
LLEALRKLGRLQLLALLLLAYAILSSSQWLGAVNQRLYSLQEQLLQSPQLDDVVIVAIDERSLTELGRWPWPRFLHAALIDRLSQAGARAIGLDLILSETEDLDSDSALAEAMRQYGTVVLPVAMTQNANAVLVNTPIDVLLEAAAAYGHASANFSPDGVMRGFTPRVEFANFSMEAFPLALARVAVPDGAFPADAERVFLPQNAANHIPAQYSYIDAITGQLPGELFANKVVLIGVTSAGIAPFFPLSDNHPDRLLPGVVFNAMSTAALLDGSLLQPATPWLQHAIALFTLLCSALAIWRTGYALSSMVFLGLSLAVLLLQQLLLRANLILPTAELLACLALSYTAQLQRTYRRLSRAMQRLHGESDAVLRAVGDGILMLDEQGVISYANERAHALLSRDDGTLAGQHIESLELRGAPGWRASDLLIQHDEKPVESLYARLPTPSSRVFKISANHMPGTEHRTAATVLALTDISRLQQLQKDLTYQTTHDPLTKLPNRSHIQQRIDASIEQDTRLFGDRPRPFMAVVLMDFDNFKRINDVLGHSAGDELLVLLAQHLREHFSDGFEIGRFGGDEFLLFSRTQLDRAELVQAINRFLNSLTQPFRIANQAIYCQCSIGIALYPQQGNHAEELIRCADLAMYQAKQHSGNHFAFYNPRWGQHSDHRLTLENALYQALAEQELEMHYQPRIELASGRVVGAEALLRWHHPEDGLRLPGSFLPAADELGLSLRIGDWVMRQVLKDIRLLSQSNTTPLRISLNLSAQQFTQSSLESQLEHALVDSGAPPDWIELEITEDMLMHDFNRANQVISRLRSRGLRVALDDFGTGYSALNYLINLPADTIKIDQAFVQQLHIQRSGDVTRSIVQLAHDLGMATVAEGAETSEQVEFLRNIGCNEVQGFYFSRALPLAHFREFVAEVN